MKNIIIKFLMYYCQMQIVKLKSKITKSKNYINDIQQTSYLYNYVNKM